MCASLQSLPFLSALSKPSVANISVSRRRTVSLYFKPTCSKLPLSSRSTDLLQSRRVTIHYSHQETRSTVIEDASKKQKTEGFSNSVTCGVDGAESADSSEGESESKTENNTQKEEKNGPEMEDRSFSSLLQSYKDALKNDDEHEAAIIEASLVSMEKAKSNAETEVSNLTKQLSSEKDRVLRISADFDNYRKRTEANRYSLLANAQGAVLESLLPILDSFERAKEHVKVESEGEERVFVSYQSIYKQLLDVLDALGLESVETKGSPFDPMVHEAITREESLEFKEGIVTEQFRKGFKLGERLLRPAMVKVSAGPGPTDTVHDSDASQEEAPKEGTNSDKMVS